jgi:5-methylcytosine-specific restriction protein A
MTSYPCIVCGVLSPNSRCDQHQIYKPDNRRGRTSNRKDYQTSPAWRALSRRARSMQDYCADCGATEDLTADHLPSAHYKIAVTKKPLTLWDIEVVCRPCNSKRGPAGLGSVRFNAWAQSVGLDLEALPRGSDKGKEGGRPPEVSPTPEVVKEALTEFGSIDPISQVVFD